MYDIGFRLGHCLGMQKVRHISLSLPSIIMFDPLDSRKFLAQLNLIGSRRARVKNFLVLELLGQAKIPNKSQRSVGGTSLVPSYKWRWM
jgi:hypothetical protein